MSDIASILGFGAIGLGFLLAVLAYHLLRTGRVPERPIYVFEGFCLVLVIIGAVLQYSSGNRTTEEIRALQAELKTTKEALSAAQAKTQAAESDLAAQKAQTKNLVAAIQRVFPDGDKLSASVSRIPNLVTQSCSGGPHGTDPLHASEIRTIAGEAAQRIASVQTAINSIVASVPAELKK
jgi:hypothetical protein